MAVATKAKKAATSTRTRTATTAARKAATTKTVTGTRRTLAASARGMGTTMTKRKTTTIPSITAKLKFRDPASLEMLDKMFKRTGANANELLRESLSWFVDNNLNVLTEAEKKLYNKKQVIVL